MVQKRYKHPKIALCRVCGGAGKVTIIDPFNSYKNITKRCYNCNGTGRVIVSGVIDINVEPFNPDTYILPNDSE